MAEYIDREQLIEHLGYLNNELPLITEHDWGRAKGYDEVIDEIKKYPCEDVQPVKHGRWIGGELGYCTCCGHKGCASDMWDGCGDIYYCPNCGARMLE